MRTTLKRGIGRSAAVDGNGRAVYPPGGVTGPIVRYRQPERRRRTALQWAGRILLLLLAGLVMLAAGLLGGAYLYFHEQVVAEVQATSKDVKAAAKRADVPLPGKPAVALVVGYDHRAGAEKDEIPRSDTIMLMRADPITNTISLLSFPRDLLVEVKCPGKPSFRDRINTAYSECGSRGTLETVRSLTGVPINYVITVNFRGFKQIVDRLGGVWIDVDRRYFNDNAGLVPGVNTYATIDLKPGYQRLKGNDALDFVRYRHTDSDLFRVARQQIFVKAIKEQVQHSFTPLTALRLVSAITKNVEIGVGGGKPLSGKTIKSYALFAYGLPAGHIFQNRIRNLQEAGPFNAELVASDADVEAAVREFTSPDVAAPEKATAVALGRKLKTLRPADITVTVLNGNGVPGSATNAGVDLGKRGYQVLVSPTAADRNAPTWDYYPTKVYFDPRLARSRQAATQVKALFQSADVAPLPAQIRPRSNGAMVVVIVGQTFHGELAPLAVDTTPKRQPPDVRSDPAATVGLLRDAARKVPFALQTPHVLETHSAPDRGVPIRVYKLNRDHRAVRLTFSTGNIGEYWGIEETDWEDAPILEHPNVIQRIKGREYALYYNGPHLHMVVLRANGATYWVVNTLLDSLSNETMLAIAKGLRPLGR